jgi:hypothetical protein
MSPILSYIFRKDTTFTPNQKCSKTILKWPGWVLVTTNHVHPCTPVVYINERLDHNDNGLVFFLSLYTLLLKLLRVLCTLLMRADVILCSQMHRIEK